MHRGEASAVAGVVRGEHLAQLGAAAFAKHNSIGSHTQRLAHQPLEPNAARPLNVDAPFYEPHYVRVRGVEFADFFHHHDPLERVNEPQRA